MDNIIYFCSEIWLKDNTIINGNVDYKDVVINLKPVCDSYIRPMIGTFFYKDLLTKWNNKTASNDELNLIEEYIKPALAWKAASESIISLSYQLKNKGIQTQSGDFSTSPEYKSIMYLVHHYSDRASVYMNMLSEYIINNKLLFDNFLNPLNNDSVIKKSCSGGNNFFDTNIILI